MPGPHETLKERAPAQQEGQQAASDFDFDADFDPERSRRLSNFDLRRAASKLDGQNTTPKNRSRAGETALAFDPPTLTFSGVGTQVVTVRNTSTEPQTIDAWQLAGDASAFETNFVGARTLSLQPGEAFTFSIRFVSERDMPQSAALIVDSTFGGKLAQLNIVGVKQGEKAQEGCSNVKISATTPGGRRNSIQSAMRSVEGAWSGILKMQSDGVSRVADIVGKGVPKATPEWQSKLDGVIAQGLSKLIGGLGLYLGGGLALATWNVLETMGLGRAEALAGAKEVSALTLKLHELVVGSYSQGALTKAATATREAIKNAKAEPTVLMREAFFDAQSKALSAAYQDAITTLNNSEGDFAALESSHPGLGFAALEAYRNHLSCHQGNVTELQRSATAGMWMAFLAQQDLGTHEPENWEQAKPGAALEKNLYNSTDAHHRMRDVARGVLELHVVWDYDHMKSRPVYSLEHARVEGVSPEFKQLLTGSPLSHFSMPIIVHGKVKQNTATGTRSGGQLRIGRNEGGAISLGAESGTKSAEMLDLLGEGDAFAGARALFAHIDQIVLPKVD